MIVIPMAGLSSRFYKAGYVQPKYMLQAHGKTLFDHALNSFERYFATESFLFIVRDIDGTVDFVKKSVEKLGIQQSHIYVLQEPTRGQAETVYLGLNSVPEYQGSITIFNIDTFRPNFHYPAELKQWDGYLEVFQGEGDNWSFAEPESQLSTKVIKTAEKDPISDLCSTGLYYFSDNKLFIESYKQYVQQPIETWAKGELYIAPLYNYLIKKKKNIHYHLIQRDDVIFCGIPDEYTAFLETSF